MVSNFDYKHRCLIEKNVPMALILPSRWQDGSESLGIERTSCLCLYDRRLALCCARLDSFAPISLIQKRSERNGLGYTVWPDWAIFVTKGYFRNGTFQCSIHTRAWYALSCSISGKHKILHTLRNCPPSITAKKRISEDETEANLSVATFCVTFGDNMTRI